MSRLSQITYYRFAQCAELVLLAVQVSFGRDPRAVSNDVSLHLLCCLQVDPSELQDQHRR